MFFHKMTNRYYTYPRALAKTETRYAQIEKELLAIVFFMLNISQIYVCGSMI